MCRSRSSPSGCWPRGCIPAGPVPPWAGCGSWPPGGRTRVPGNGNRRAWRRCWPSRRRITASRGTSCRERGSWWPAAPQRRTRSSGPCWPAAGLPATVLTGGVAYSLFGITGQPAHRLAGWFLAVAGDQAAWDADRRAIAAELAAVAAGHRGRGEEAQRVARRTADGAFRRVLDRPAGTHGLEDPEIAAALRRCGLAPFAPLVAVALTAVPVGAAPEASGMPGDEAVPQRSEERRVGKEWGTGV